jgi:hypothetical protein
MAVLTAAAMAVPGAAAQQPLVIGFLSSRSVEESAPFVAAFHRFGVRRTRFDRAAIDTCPCRRNYRMRIIRREFK